jgi:hypothetical protein
VGPPAFGGLRGDVTEFAELSEIAARCEREEPRKELGGTYRLGAVALGETRDDPALVPLVFAHDPEPRWARRGRQEFRF